MKKEVLFVLLNEFADWEGVFLSAGLKVGYPAESLYEAKTLAVTKKPVCSIGGWRVVPDYDLETVPGDFAALILVGGLQWRSAEAELLVPLVEQAIRRNAVVGGICNASLFLGAHGFLNDVKHTSNTLQLLQEWGGSNYTNAANYIHCQAVADRNIVTANGTGYLEFMREVLLLLRSDTPEKIEEFYNLHKIGFCELMKNQ